MKRFSSPTIVVTLINLILVGALIVTIAHAQDGSSDFPSVQPAAIDSPSSLLFSYQGQLNDSDGNPITDSAVNMTFKLYDVAENGTACWSEEHTGTNAVSVQSGLFNVLLGQITPIDTACLANDVYLELDVNGETMSPRELLTSVAFSAVADDVSAPLNVNGAIKSSGVDGGILMAKNPNNQDAAVHLSWLNDVARIRIGGPAPGGDGGLDIQTQQDVSLMRLLGNGNVGIGTVDPNARLEVSGGGVIVNGETDETNILITNAHDVDNSNGATGGLRLINGSNANDWLGIDNNEIASYGDKLYLQYSGATEGVEIGQDLYVDSNVGIGTVEPNARLEVSGGGVIVNGETDETNILITNAYDVDNSNGATGGLRLINGSDANDWLGIDNNEIASYGGKLYLQYSGATEGVEIGQDLHVVGNISCGAYIESNLQTPQESESETIERFEEGDVLCWSPKESRLEQCSLANDRLVVAVASKAGKPIVMGAENIKVLGPVQAGDILVASGIPGYAAANNDPPPGTVIAKAMEDFNGDRGLILAMIDGR